MDIYLKNLHNFITSFKNNLYNEYNKNEILSTKLSNYKKVYDNNLIKKILVQTDNLILKGINKLYTSYTLTKYNNNRDNLINNNNNNRDNLINNIYNKDNLINNIYNKDTVLNQYIDNRDTFFNKQYRYNFINNKDNISCKDLSLYKNTLINKFKYLYYKYKEWFLSKDKFYVEYNLIRNINNLDNYTEEGLSDYHLIENINNIIDIRNIENPEYFTFEFEITVVDKKTNKINNKICKIKIEKEDQQLKISEISCSDL